MKLNLFYFLFFACTLFACKTEKPAPIPTPALKPFSSILDSLIKQGGGDCEGGADCMKVRAVWPVVKNGNPKIKDKLNAFIKESVIFFLEFNPDDEFSSIEASADSLIQMYINEHKNEPSMSMEWAIDVEGKIVFHDSIANLEIFQYSYMGGAHGNYGTGYMNFNLNSGNTIEYADFVQDSVAFKQATQQYFENHIATAYKEFGLTMDDLFWGEGFYLPSNFSLEKDSIAMIFNPYEAAPYVVGAIDFKVAYSDLGKSIKL